MPEPPNVSAVVPLLMVTNMERSLAFYTTGLGFKLQNTWIPRGKIEWCWLTLGTASLMFQEPRNPPIGSLGNGVSLWFQCTDALTLYREVATRNIHPTREPQVGNSNWEICFQDPDGYSINFSSPTDVPEETLLSQTRL